MNATLKKTFLFFGAYLDFLLPQRLTIIPTAPFVFEAIRSLCHSSILLKRRFVFHVCAHVCAPKRYSLQVTLQQQTQLHAEVNLHMQHLDGSKPAGIRHRSFFPASHYWLAGTRFKVYVCNYLMKQRVELVWVRYITMSKY